MQIQLQQAQSAKTMSENMNQGLQVCCIHICFAIESFSHTEHIQVIKVQAGVCLPKDISR